MILICPQCGGWKSYGPTPVHPRELSRPLKCTYCPAAPYLSAWKQRTTERLPGMPR